MSEIKLEDFKVKVEQKTEYIMKKYFPKSKDDYSIHLVRLYVNLVNQYPTKSEGLYHMFMAPTISVYIISNGANIDYDEMILDCLI